MTTCSGEDSFVANYYSTDGDSLVGGCFAVVEGETLNGLHYFAFNGTVAEEGEYIIYGSSNSENLVWALVTYGTGTFCVDDDENDASTVHPTAVTQWECEEDEDEDDTLANFMTTTCGCSTIEPTPAPTSTSGPMTLSTPAPLETPEPAALYGGLEDTPFPTNTSSIVTSSNSSDQAPVGVIVGTLAGVAALAAMGAFLWRRRAVKNENVGPPPGPDAMVGENLERGGEHGEKTAVGSRLSIVLKHGNGSSGLSARRNSWHTETTRERDTPPPPYPDPRGVAADAYVDDCEPAATLSAAPRAAGAVRYRNEQTALPDGTKPIAGGVAKGDTTAQQQLLATATNSTANASTEERVEHATFASSPEEDAAPGEGGPPSAASVRKKSGDIGCGEAVMAAAHELAQHCQIPGVSEAATVLSILVRLVSDSQDNLGQGDANLKRCRSIVVMLERAAKVLGKSGETSGEAARVLMEDVHDALSDVVELIMTHKSKNRLSRVLMSTLFKQRQDELDAVVDRAILRLHLGLQVQVGHDVSAVKEGMHRLRKESLEESMWEARAEARSAKRQRKLNQLEIPEDHVLITDDLLGKGGFGEVFVADYNGRNAAAKVQFITHGFGRLDEVEMLDGPRGGEHGASQQKSQRQAFLRELDIMIRLRSPHTVNVYGAITSLTDRLVLVMELLAGGDLRNMLKHCEHPLPEEKSRQIIRDICAGMSFLHSKGTVHGDLKSANILLDRRGRAKIGDFGTSRWAPDTENSTGLITHATKAGPSINVSFAWTAPEVLEKKATSNASDVYSFGVLVWEILSRQVPWAGQALPRDIYVRVVVHGDRPTIPADTPADMVAMLRDCWAQAPEERPTFQALMNRVNFFPTVG